MTKFPHKIFRTGLAVMLAGFVFVQLNFTCVSFAEEPKPESDSLILARHLREVKVEYAIEEFSEHSFNSHFSDKQLDSILFEDSRITFRSAKMIYAPDSAFKIAVIEGESCGAYCNQFWTTWFHFNDGSGLCISEPGYENVISIEKLDDKYLVWEYTIGRSGAIGYYTTTVSLLTLQGHQIVYDSFPVIPSQVRMERSKNPLGSFSITTTTDAESEFLCAYNSQSKELNYQYEMDPYWTNEDDSCQVYSGSFLYSNGRFELQKEICQTRKPD